MNTQVHQLISYLVSCLASNIGIWRPRILLNGGRNAGKEGVGEPFEKSTFGEGQEREKIQCLLQKLF